MHLYHSQIRLCVKWTYNVHIYIYIYNIEHRNLEIQKPRNDISVQVRNLLLPLSLKVLRHKDRDTHSFYSAFSSAPPHLVQHLPKASASKRKPTVFFRGRTQLYELTFSKSRNPLRASGAWRHSHLLAPFPIWAIVTSLSETFAPRACASTPVLMLHLSNLCTEPKGSQPN